MESASDHNELKMNECTEHDGNTAVYEKCRQQIACEANKTLEEILFQCSFVLRKC